MVCPGEVMVFLPGGELVGCLVEITEDDGGAARYEFCQMPAGDCIHDVLAGGFGTSTSS